MALSNTARSYGGVTKTFHWLTALLILTVIPLGWIASDLAHTVNDPSHTPTEAEVARAAFLFSLHKTIGVTIFFVALARILWTLTQTKPGLLNAENKPEAFAAETVHWLLYGSLVLVPLTGWIHHAATEGFAPIWWPLGQDLPFVPKGPAIAAVTAGLHWVLQWVLVIAVGLHIAGAVKHHVIDGDFTLRRMLPGSTEAPEPPTQDHARLPIVAALVLWGVALTAGAWVGAFDTHGASAPAGAELAEVQSDWQVQEGSLAITVMQLGSPVTGEFADWTAAITFDDPAEPGPAGTAEVTISVGSLSLGSVTAQALGADFFHAETFPTASFNAELVKTDTGYEARGPLTIRDKTVDIALPFTLDMEGDTANVTGELELQRLDFGIGSKMPDEGSLAFAVKVAMNLTATRSQ
ncbi:cytochrome b/b6 domain-containing protein [Ruegeria sp. HKCCD8929]|uniref:cytochrome b/b6 domain-containing protein n=1 Tax=Ruegeria sp. HKCCD8929 TaxID=2683006 RepID=UPI001487A019|nr:cytochrome b/b6 domain-containing protein [Ruegeria sp. HKCCD8929]